MNDHLCSVCFRSFREHPERCTDTPGGGDCDAEHWPPLCCPGCDCGSYEEAHAERSAES